MMVYFGRVVDNERGSVLNVAMLVLMLMALIGVAVSRSTTTDVKISGNYKVDNMAFYAAEATRAFLVTHPELYDSENITPNVDPGDDNGVTIATTAIGDKESYDGYVEYMTASTPPRGAGVDAAVFRAHNYKLTSNRARAVKFRL